MNESGSRPNGPPSALEDRIVDALMAENLLKTSQKRQWFASAQSYIAALLLLTLGTAIGHWGPQSFSSPDVGQEYVLLLYQSSSDANLSAEANDGRAREYGIWARSIGARTGVSLLAASELSDKSWVFTQPGKGSPSAIPASNLGAPVGYFVIKAPSVAAALDIADSCPHLKYGGALSLTLAR